MTMQAPPLPPVPLTALDLLFRAWVDMTGKKLGHSYPLPIKNTDGLVIGAGYPEVRPPAVMGGEPKVHMKMRMATDEDWAYWRESMAVGFTYTNEQLMQMGWPPEVFAKGTDAE